MLFSFFSILFEFKNSLLTAGGESLIDLPLIGSPKAKNPPLLLLDFDFSVEAAEVQ